MPGANVVGQAPNRNPAARRGQKKGHAPRDARRDPYRYAANMRTVTGRVSCVTNESGAMNNTCSPVRGPLYVSMT